MCLDVYLFYVCGVGVHSYMKQMVFVYVDVQLVAGREIEERQKFQFISAAQASQVNGRVKRLVVGAANNADERTRQEGRGEMFPWSWHRRAC